MAITKDSGRQYPLVARVSFTFEDLGTAVVATGNGVQPAIDLPPGAIVIGGYLNVTEAWVGPTVATADIGDGADLDRYTASAIDLLAAGRTELDPSGYEYGAGDTIDIDLVQTVAVSTAGAAELVVEYIIENRAQENQG